MSALTPSTRCYVRANTARGDTTHMASTDDGIQEIIDQVAMEEAMGLIAAGIQAAGLTAVEVVDVDAYMDTASRIARRIVVDADSDAARGEAASWSEQARNQIRHVIAEQNEAVTLGIMEQHLKDGLEYVTPKKRRAATDQWVTKRVKEMLGDGTLRETESTGSGKIEINFTETEEG